MYCGVPWAWIALGCKCVGVWSITMVATHSPQKHAVVHVASFTRPSSPLAESFFCASYKLKVGEEGLGTRLVYGLTDIHVWCISYPLQSATHMSSSQVQHCSSASELYDVDLP